MGMIQGIDAGALINAFRQGQSDRASEEARRAAEAKQRQIGGLLTQLGGGEAPTLQGQFAPSNPTAAPAEGTSPATPSMSPATPSMSPQAMQAPPRQPNPDVLRQLIALDPETGTKIAGAFKAMDEQALKQAEARNTMMAAAARTLRGIPQEQRPQYLQAIAPQLLGLGFTAEQLTNADLSDNGLHMLEATGIDLDAMIDNELAEREFGLKREEFDAGKVLSVQPGGMAVRIRPNGNNEVIVAPGGAAPNSASGLPAPKSKEEFDRLPPGAAFVAPDGTVRTKPGGGGASNGTGTFQP